MSYSTLPAPSDLFGVNSGIRSRVFPLNNDRRSEESHSPTSEPRSPLFRPALPAAELPPHLVSLYNSPYAAAAVAAAMAGQGSGAPATTAAHFGHFGRVPSSFYPTMVGGEAWRRPPYLSQLDMYWPGLRSLEAVVGPRTKAPREATSILKSWLNEHKDNPYPTKSEKMTLSIVTHMTLTQVSTWFANARRRIKKENKMTWTPKTRSGERDDNSSNEEESDRDYFGIHQRSPFSTSRNSADGSFSSFDESKRAAISEGRSTIPCGQSSLRTAHSYPIFSGLNGLNQDCRRQAEGNTPRADEIKFSVKRAMHSNDSTPDDASADNNSKPYHNKPSAVKQSISDDQVSADEEKGISRPPFIQLGKRRSYSIEQNASTADSRVEEDSHSPKRPHYSHPIPPTRNDTAVYGHPMHHRNVDVISSWMKDFQHLVTTGQEDKARQALAAFALAAKAGAYPEIGTNAAFSQVRGPQNNSSERKSPMEHSSINPIRQTRNSILFSPSIQGDHRQDDNHRRSDSSDDERKPSLTNSPFVNFAARKSSTSNHCNQKSTNDRSESLKAGRTISDVDWKSKENGSIKPKEDSAK